MFTLWGLGAAVLVPGLVFRVHGFKGFANFGVWGLAFTASCLGVRGFTSVEEGLALSGNGLCMQHGGWLGSA